MTFCIIKFFIRLQQMSDDRLLKKVYLQSKYLKYNLYKLCSTMLHEYNIELERLLVKDIKYASKFVKEQMIKYYTAEWYSAINSPTGVSKTGGNKLRTYCTFKKEFGIENYLTTITNRKYRTFWTQFRISAHKLRIESGRYEKLVANERICQLCQMNEVESELHFALKCPYYVNERKIFLNTIPLTYKNYDPVELFQTLMTSTDNICINFIKFLYICYEKRLKYLTK